MSLIKNLCLALTTFVRKEHNIKSWCVPIAPLKENLPLVPTNNHLKLISPDTLITKNLPLVSTKKILKKITPCHLRLFVQAPSTQTDGQA